MDKLSAFLSWIEQRQSALTEKLLLRGAAIWQFRTMKMARISSFVEKEILGQAFPLPSRQAGVPFGPPSLLLRVSLLGLDIC